MINRNWTTEAEPSIPLYLIAAATRLNPTRLSRLLSGREPMTSKLEQRILDALTGLRIPVG